MLIFYVILELILSLVFHSSSKHFFFFFFLLMGTKNEHNVPFLESASHEKRKRSVM